jgi:tartrate-resistant acid phosphatase type 5
MGSFFPLVGLLFFFCGTLASQTFHVYVGHLETNAVVLAWGHTDGGGNTIGRGSKSHGNARVQVGDRRADTTDSWATISGLKPDTTYPYEVILNGISIAKGSVRTHPEKADRVAFFVIGDWGTGGDGQYKIAAAMKKEMDRRAGTNNPVRFVLTTGDNIYSPAPLGRFSRESGDSDRDWGPKFFVPYRDVLRRMPFYASLGNHDGNESEKRDDLTVYLDNLFFPGGKAARYYQLSYGGLLDCFAIDSSMNSEKGGSRSAIFAPGGEQHQWLERQMRASKALWKIPFFHHPIYNAGPRHGSSYQPLRHFVKVFEETGVRVVFTGHEHNFQLSEANDATKGVLYVITGAGGQLRDGDVRSAMKDARIAAWAPQHHFLVVEIFGNTMKITPISYEPMNIVDAKGSAVKGPFTVVADPKKESLTSGGK